MFLQTTNTTSTIGVLVHVYDLYQEEEEMVVAWRMPAEHCSVVVCGNKTRRSGHFPAVFVVNKLDFFFSKNMIFFWPYQSVFVPKPN